MHIMITELRDQATCELTGKQEECLLVTVDRDPPALLSFVALRNLIRFRSKLATKNGNPAAPAAETPAT